MKKILFAFSVLCFLGALPALAQENTALPEMPEPIKELVNQGAQVRYLGRDYNMDAWLTIKGGQEQYFYVLPDRSAFLMGVLFDSKGKVVTVEQVQKLQKQTGDNALLDTLTGDLGASQNKTVTKKFETPSEQMFDDIENANWVPLGQPGAPVAYAFVDPQCPHCHEFVKDLRKDYIEAGRINLRLVPIGFKDETVAQAAFLLATPNPQERWFKHMDGDKEALPAKSEINQQGVQRNLAVMHSWKFDVTPLIVYRAKDNAVKIVRGRPKNIPGFVADLGARS